MFRLCRHRWHVCKWLKTTTIHAQAVGGVASSRWQYLLALVKLASSFPLHLQFHPSFCATVEHLVLHFNACGTDSLVVDARHLSSLIDEPPASLVPSFPINSFTLITVVVVVVVVVALLWRDWQISCCVSLRISSIHLKHDTYCLVLSVLSGVGSNLQVGARRPKIFWCPPLFSCAPTWGAQRLFERQLKCL